MRMPDNKDFAAITRGLRQQTVDDAHDEYTNSTDGFAPQRYMNYVSRQRDQANANFTDPSGALGFALDHTPKTGFRKGLSAQAALQGLKMSQGM